jgi:5-methylcytosine-specific restriction endonuclease McrA
MIMRICAKAGCNILVKKEEKYCEAHKKDYDKSVKDSYKWSKKNRDDEWEQKFYNSDQWRRTKNGVLERDIFLCRLCYEEKRLIDADLVHHIIELKEDRDYALDEDFLISLCDRCHKIVHVKYKTDSRKELQEQLKKLAASPPGQRKRQHFSRS